MSAKKKLEAAARESAVAEVLKKHPQLINVRPRVYSRADGNFTLSFQKRVKLPDGAVLRQTLRATIDPAGHVLRVMGSRGGGGGRASRARRL